MKPAVLGITPHGFVVWRDVHGLFHAGCQGPWTLEQCKEYWLSPDYGNLKRGRAIMRLIEKNKTTRRTTLIVPNAYAVYAGYCPVLTRLTAPKAERVSVRGSVAVTHVSAPKAKVVYAEGCPALTTLHARKAWIYR